MTNKSCWIIVITIGCIDFIIHILKPNLFNTCIQVLLFILIIILWGTLMYDLYKTLKIPRNP